MTKETQTTLRRFLRTSTVLLWTVVIAAAILIASFVSEGFLSDHESNNTITVTGTASVDTAPTEATINFGVRADNAAQDAAQLQVEEIVSEIMSELADIAVGEESLGLDGYNVSPRYDYSEDGSQFITGYEVSQRISIMLDNPKISGEVLALLGEVGATDVNGPHFSVTDTSGFEDFAREEAIANARKEAEVIAQQLGVELGKMVDFYINDDYRYEPTPYFAKTTVFGSADEEFALDAVSIPQGTKDIQVSVTMTFKTK
jgi:uncharacterized protein YggE